MSVTHARGGALRAMPWALIVTLGAGALIRPVLSVLGVYESGPLEKPVGPVLFTALIAVVWLAAAVLLRVDKPVEVLTLAGVAYGVFALVLNLTLNLFMDSAEVPPMPGMIGILVFNALEGAVLGLIALGILRLRERSGE